MRNKLVKTLKDFATTLALGTTFIVLPIVGIAEYNRHESNRQELFNFHYRGMDAKVMHVEYPLDESRYLLFEDGATITRGKLISDEGDTISICSPDYSINGVRQK